MAQTFFVTTPIYYVNDVPHIGHAYTTIAADVLARYHRLLGHEVYFLTGTDEHGQKIQQAAEANQETPQALADRVCQRFIDLWKILEISHDDFIRTTETRHRHVVESFFKAVQAKGDIYLGMYEDWYCTPCETFLTTMQLLEGKCPQCGRDVKKISEESYFFKLAAYQDELIKLLRTPGFVQPESRRHEVLNFVEQGLKDLSLSRTSFNWGIPVPGDSKHVIYVWFDALLNYISALGYVADKPNEKFKKFWPADIQLVGKDILRFHTVYWPAFLLSGGVALPKKIFAHGWWTVDGKKMSKSLGNVVDPAAVAQKYGTDAFRYFLLQEVPFGQDGNFSITALENRLNSDLANDLGNLLSRTLGMNAKYFGAKAPRLHPEKLRELDHKLQGDIANLYSDTKKLDAWFGECAFHQVLAAVFQVVRAGNKYIDTSQPWTLAKDPQQIVELENILYHLFEILRLTAVILWPFMPKKMQEMWEAMGMPQPIAAGILPSALGFGQFPKEAKPHATAKLFPRLEAPT